MPANVRTAQTYPANVRSTQTYARAAPKNEDEDSDSGAKRHAMGDSDDEANQRSAIEAARLQKEMEAEEESRKAAERIARELAEQEEKSLDLVRQLAAAEDEERAEFEALRHANQTFDCGICADTYHEGFKAQAEPCKHEVCRECMLQHVKSQVEETHWPIFCPMCPPQEEKRGSEY